MQKFLAQALPLSSVRSNLRIQTNEKEWGGASSPKETHLHEPKSKFRTSMQWTCWKQINPNERWSLICEASRWSRWIGVWLVGGRAWRSSAVEGFPLNQLLSSQIEQLGAGSFYLARQNNRLHFRSLGPPLLNVFLFWHQVEQSDLGASPAEFLPLLHTFAQKFTCIRQSQDSHPLRAGHRRSARVHTRRSAHVRFNPSNARVASPFGAGTRKHPVRLFRRTFWRA